jgi:hypothetical protein
MLRKSIAAALAVAIGAVSFATSAEAGRRHHHHHGGDALAAGIFGFAAGALITSLAQPRYVYDPYYYQPAPVYAQPPVYSYQPAPVYNTHPAPWTPEWYAYCDNRYISFDSRTGYFYGYDGEYHFCR